MANTGKKNFTGVPFGSNLYMVNPRYHNNFSTITYNGSTYPINNILNLDKDNNAIEVEYDYDDNPMKEWITPSEDFWATNIPTDNQASIQQTGYTDDLMEKALLNNSMEGMTIPQRQEYLNDYEKDKTRNEAWNKRAQMMATRGIGTGTFTGGELQPMTNYRSSIWDYKAPSIKGPAEDIDKVMLGTLGLGIAPVAIPEVATALSTMSIPFEQTIANTLANPYVQAGLTSAFAAGAAQEMPHTLQNTSAAREEFMQHPSWYTGLNYAGELGKLGLNVSMFVPPTKALVQGGKQLYDAASNIGRNIADRYLFVQRPDTWTRGIGMGREGLDDAIRTGVIRGNPRGTERTAHDFTKLYNRNRDHFRDIMEDTGIKGIESKYQSRTLSEEEFNAIKKASANYTKQRMVMSNGTFTMKTLPADPLSDYPTYADYINSIKNDVEKVEQMPSRIASGEVKVDTDLTPTSEIPTGRPVIERFGPNSDYIVDGTPLSYWYNDGRNPIKKGHDYAGSNYGVRVNNIEDYTPFMHQLHLHPSFFRSPRLEDPQVEVFQKGPFGLTVKLDKETMQPLWKQDLKNGVSELYNGILDYAARMGSDYAAGRQLGRALNENIGNTRFAIGEPTGGVYGEVPRITAENMAGKSADSWEAAYARALNSGDVAEQQRLIGLRFANDANNSATVSGSSPQILYHTGRDNVTSFKKPSGNASISYDDLHNLSWAEKEGYEISPEELVKYNNGETAVVNKPTGTYLSDDNITSRTYLGKEPDVNTTYELYANVENPYIIEGNGQQLYSDADSVEALKEAVRNGNDSVFLKNIRDYGPNEGERLVEGEFQDSPSTTIIVQNPTTQLKSADPVTYDNNGWAIPITERFHFDPQDVDIRGRGWFGEPIEVPEVNVPTSLAKGEVVTDAPEGSGILKGYDINSVPSLTRVPTDSFGYPVSDTAIPYTGTLEKPKVDWTGWEKYRQQHYDKIMEDWNNNGPLRSHLERSGITNPEIALDYVMSPKELARIIQRESLDDYNFATTKFFRDYVKSNPEYAKKYIDNVVDAVENEFGFKLNLNTQTLLKGLIKRKNMEDLMSDIRDAVSARLKRSGMSEWDVLDAMYNGYVKDGKVISFDNAVDSVRNSALKDSDLENKFIEYLYTSPEFFGHPYKAVAAPWYYGLIHVPLNADNYGVAFSHEFGHLEDLGDVAKYGVVESTQNNYAASAKSPLFKKAFNLSKLSKDMRDYFTGKKGDKEGNLTEIVQRATQLKDFDRLSKGQKITGKRLKELATEYLKSGMLDNNMTEFFSTIKDYEAAAEWINRFGKAIIPSLIGAGTAYGLSNNDSNVQALGGPLARMANMFDNGGYKYYMKPSDVGYYAPEVRVTPSGSGPAAILENGDYGVTAGTLNYMGVPIYEEGKELNDIQYRTQPTNAEASHLADDMVSATEFKPQHLLTAPLQGLMPLNISNWIGLADEDNNMGLAYLYSDKNPGFFIGNDPTKPFSKQFAKEHPYWAMSGNLIGDALGTLGVGKTLKTGYGKITSTYDDAKYHIDAFRENWANPYAREDMKNGLSDFWHLWKNSIKNPKQGRVLGAYTTKSYPYTGAGMYEYSAERPGRASINLGGMNTKLKDFNWDFKPETIGHYYGADGTVTSGTADDLLQVGIEGWEPIYVDPKKIDVGALKRDIEGLPSRVGVRGDANSNTLGQQLALDYSKGNYKDMLLHFMHNTGDFNPVRVPKRGGYNVPVLGAENSAQSPAAEAMLYGMRLKNPWKFDLRYSTHPAGNFNNYATGINRPIYEAEQAYLAGNMSAEDYVELYNKWLEGIEGKFNVHNLPQDQLMRRAYVDKSGRVVKPQAWLIRKDYGGPLVQMANRYEMGGPKKKLEPYYGIYGNVSPYIGEGAPILQYDVDSDEWYSDTWSDDNKRVKQERGWYKNAPQSFKDNYWMVVDPNGDKIKYVSSEKYKAGSDWYNGRSPMFGSGSWSDNSNSYANPFEEEKIIDGKVVWPEEGEFYIDGQQIYTDGEGGGYTEYEPFTAPNSYDEGGSLNTHKKWEDLSMKERGEMIRVAVRNGITNLSDIKSKYNEFAEGGNLYAKGNPLKKATLSPNVQYAIRYFMNKGLAPHQAAGLVGNLMRESSSNLNIGARNPNGGAFGIAQWLGARQKNLFARYGRTPSLQQQLDYVWHELNTTHKNGLRSLLASRDAAEAARNAFGWYEFSVGPEGAVADMNRHNQNGTWALNKGVQFASQLMGQPVPQIVNLPQQQIPQAPIGYVQEQPQGTIIPPLTPYNQEAFYNQDNTSNNQALIDMMNSIQDQYNAYQEDVRRKELAQQEAAIKQQRMQGLSTLLSMFGSMNQDEGTSPFNYMANMLTMMPNT